MHNDSSQAEDVICKFETIYILSKSIQWDLISNVGL